MKKPEKKIKKGKKRKSGNVKTVTDDLKRLRIKEYEQLDKLRHDNLEELRDRLHRNKRVSGDKAPRGTKG